MNELQLLVINKNKMYQFYIQIDYNECDPESNLHIEDCGTGATCTNEVGTYSCQCDDGYEGTAPECTPGMYTK